MGGRLLKRWLALPLKDSNKIRSRHEVVSIYKKTRKCCKKMQKQISDLERLISKIASEKCRHAKWFI
jgi:DNA mismatch repair protein MutS